MGDFEDDIREEGVLWLLDERDKAPLSDLESFLFELIRHRSNRPGAILGLVRLLQALQRMPLFIHGVDVEVDVYHRYGRESISAKMSLMDGRFALSTSGVANSGWGSDSYGNEIFVRHVIELDEENPKDQPLIGMASDVVDWLCAAREILHLESEVSVVGYPEEQYDQYPQPEERAAAWRILAAL